MADSDPAKAGTKPLLDQTGIVVSPAAIFYAGGISVTAVGNDFSLGFTAPRQGFGPNIPEGQAAFIFEPVVSISLSVKTLKDLVLSATERLDKYEKEFGKVVTDYSRSVEGKK